MPAARSSEALSPFQMELMEYIGKSGSLPPELKKECEVGIAGKDPEILNKIVDLIDWAVTFVGKPEEGAKHAEMRDKLKSWIKAIEERLPEEMEA